VLSLKLESVSYFFIGDFHVAKLLAETLRAGIRITDEITRITVFGAEANLLSDSRLPRLRIKLPRLLFRTDARTAYGKKALSLRMGKPSCMDEILKIDTIDRYNKLFGFETRHPLVGVVRFDTAESQGNYRMTMGFYSVFLKETRGCRINYGKTGYDFDDQTVVSIAPGQTVGYTDIEGIPTKSVGLLFHPDFIRGTSLGRKIRKYTFFSYEANEALHLSEEERTIVLDCLKKIEMELRHAIDKHSKGLIATNIELLLDYCMRFYERQFVTREDLNLDALARFERLLDDYLSEGVAAREGLPSVRYFADKICLSPNYFGDLVKKETGKSAQEYIQLKMIDAAKEGLLDPNKTIGQVAYELGFQYPQHFVRFFKRHVGYTPREYRLQS